MDLKPIRDKLVGSEEQRAVSPVIGVILMVAITVILAAVIATFVMDMGSGLSQEAQGSVTIDGNDTATVTVTTESLANADAIAVIEPSNASAVTSGTHGNVDIDSVSGNPSETVGTEITIEGDTSGSASTTGTEDFNVIAYNGNSVNPDDRSGENIIAEITVNTT